MISNGLIKALLLIKHEYFMGMTGIENKKKLLASIKQENALKDAFQ